MKHNTLNLSTVPNLFPLTYTNGPGLRYVMWTQGCSLRCCSHCLNPELLNPFDCVEAGIYQILDHLSQLKKDTPVEGITLLGGEPTDQSAALSQLLPAVRQLGLTVMLYTGYTFETLQRPGSGKEILDLLQWLDILVEGNYIQNLDFPGTLWRGSLNQRILLLSHRYDVIRIKTLLQNTAREISGRVEMIPYYNGSRMIRKHWLEPLPRSQAHDHKNCLPQDHEITQLQLFDRPVLSWLPELAKTSGTGETFLSPKGLTGVLDADNRLHLFGFQKEEVVETFKAALGTQGIRC
jgi:anaerobic ribonucleoside-triphosphate reductase activating protein